MSRSFLVRLIAPPLTVLATLAACADQSSPLVPHPPGTMPGQVTLQAFSCTADVRMNEVSCGSGATSPRGPDRIVITGQGIYVRLTSSNLNYEAGIYTFDATVQNLIPQTLGIGTNGLPDGNGVSVVFWQEPIATEGTGIITVNNAQEGSFLRPKELYYRYDQTLAPNQVSAPRQWSFSVPATVVRFSFSVYVAASVRYPHGWIDIAGAPTLQVARNGTISLSAVVRDSVGRDITASAGPVTWSLANPSVATISGPSLTGAASAGQTTLSATAGTRSGSALLIVGTPFTQIAAGHSHTCALTAAGRAYCWGLNSQGQLGDSSTTDRRTPVGVKQGSLTFVEIVAGRFHTCARSPAGQAYCWGDNGAGQLGDNTYFTRLTPVAVLQGTAIYTQLTGGDAHTCALSSTGQAYCWGYNRYGQLGNGRGGRSALPSYVPGAVQQNFITYARITAGVAHTCAITATGQGYCWGTSQSGALANGTDTDHYAPYPMRQGTSGPAVQIVAGASHTCTLSAAGQTYCWGSNGYGQLGNLTPPARGRPGAVLQSANTYVEISSEYDHTCGRSSAGQLYCWGSNLWGQLGNNATYLAFTPVAVLQGTSTFVSVAAGGAHTCARTASGQVYCWGANNAGQLGDNTVVERHTPVAVQ